jgi:hypothetical protein
MLDREKRSRGVFELFGDLFADAFFFAAAFAADLGFFGHVMDQALAGQIGGQLVTTAAFGFILICLIGGLALGCGVLRRGWLVGAGIAKSGCVGWINGFAEEFVSVKRRPS